MYCCKISTANWERGGFCVALLKMCTELQLTKYPESFNRIFYEIRDTYEARAELILSDAYISEVLASCYTLSDYKDVIIKAAGRVRENPAMRLLVCILEQWVRSGYEDFADYEAPDGVGIEFDFIHLFPMIPTMPESVAHLRARELPEDIIAATMQEYDYCVEMIAERKGRPGFDKGRLSWMKRIVKCTMLRIGRLKFDLPSKRVSGIRAYKNAGGDICVLADGVSVHKSGRILGSAGLVDKEDSFLADIEETDDTYRGYPVCDGVIENQQIMLKKSEWSLCLSGDDDVIAVHIPPGGGLDEESVESSYARAREIFAKYYPELSYKAFHCRSWLMSRDLRKILKPTSNILAFQKKYINYPCESNGTWIFGNVFPKIGVPEDYSTLPEDTSLQRSVKKLYLDGGYILDGCGFFF